MASLPSSLNSTNVRIKLARTVFLAWQRARLGVASRVAPQRAVEMAARLFATPPRHPRTAKEQAWLDGGAGFDVPHGPQHLAAWRFGDARAPAVVLSHGWGGRGAQLRSFAQPLVDAGFQVIAFDHVGHGASTGDESTLPQFIEGIDAVVRAVERDAPIAGLVGHSLGAAAVTAWLNGNGRAIRAVLVSPPSSVERHARWFARRLGLHEHVRDGMRRRLEERYRKRWSEFELPACVSNIRAPALVVHDVDDEDVSFAAGLALARAWPGARMVATRGLGHRAILRDAQVVRDATDFLAARVMFAPPPAPGERAAYATPAPLL
jgi:pimeloyl-ACP methyl ester carboxylesterase